MKKRLTALLLGACVAASLAACGGSRGDSTEEATDATESGGARETTKADRTEPPAVASIDMDIDPGELVTKLCDYKGIPVTITGSYEVDEEALREVILADLEACRANIEEVTDRDTVEEGDVVKVDYTGYLEGEAFEGGAATGAYVKVGNGTGYIDGFTDGLVGAKVGDELDHKVTFPEDYGKEELKGRETTFHFKIYGIYRELEDYDALVEAAKDEESPVNTNVEATFGSFGITDFNGLVEYETDYAERRAQSQKYTDTVTAIKDYMLQNCEVEVPEDYLEARVTEYQISFENGNLSDDQTLEDYLQSGYGTTVEDAQETWKENVEEQIRSELIFGLIAEKEKLELDETEFGTFVDNIVSSSSSSSSGAGFADADDVYEYYGAGVAENGKKYMQKLFLMNKAIDIVYDAAEVTVEEPQGTESAETSETEAED